jgi:hypothetical protein
VCAERRTVATVRFIAVKNRDIYRRKMEMTLTRHFQDERRRKKNEGGNYFEKQAPS